jgi:hypothetical protein
VAVSALKTGYSLHFKMIDPRGGLPDCGSSTAALSAIAITSVFFLTACAALGFSVFPFFPYQHGNKGIIKFYLT